MAAPVPTKRCPGFAPGGIDPHEQAATREFFASNAGNKDGLATRCKACGKRTAGLGCRQAQGREVQRPPPQGRAARGGEPAARGARAGHHAPDGSPVFTATAPQRGEREATVSASAVSPPSNTLTRWPCGPSGARPRAIPPR